MTRDSLELLADFLNSISNPVFLVGSRFFISRGDIDTPLCKLANPLRSAWITVSSCNSPCRLTIDNSGMIINCFPRLVMFIEHEPVFVRVNVYPKYGGRICRAKINSPIDSLTASGGYIKRFDDVDFSLELLVNQSRILPKIGHVLLLECIFGDFIFSLIYFSLIDIGIVVRCKPP